MAHRSTDPPDTDEPTGSAMPEVDWLTGLASREAFARAVNQADRDRDPMVVVALAVEDFPDLNRLCGYEAGDDLLRTLGRVLADRTSVDVSAGRLGGNRFGLLWTPAGTVTPENWLAPILADLRHAAARWIAHRLGLGGPSPVTPELVAGIGSGFSARTWVEAELALELAADPSGPPVVSYDPDDPRVVQHRWRQRVVDDLAAAMRHDRLSVVAGPVEPLTGPGPGRWLRLGPSLRGAARAEDRGGGHDAGPDSERNADLDLDRDRIVVAAAHAAPGLARGVERRLLDRAGELVTGATGQLRVTVPLIGPIAGRRSPLRLLVTTIDRGPAPPTRILLELDQEQLLSARGATELRELSAALSEIGSGLVVAGYTGGWESWRAIDGVPIAYLKPHPELITAAANPGSAAAGILAAVVGNASRADRQLVAPSGPIPDQALIELGFHHVERPATRVLRR
jgi:GGDEF domain-containing protein